MTALPMILAQLDGDLSYDDGAAGGDGTGTGAVRYRDGHTGSVQGALLEEGTTNAYGRPFGGASWGFSSLSLQAISLPIPGYEWITTENVIPDTVSGANTILTPDTTSIPGAPLEAGTYATMSVFFRSAAPTHRVVLEMHGGATSYSEVFDDDPSLTTWQRHILTRTIAQPDRTSFKGQVTWPSRGTQVAYQTALQIEFGKAHATTPCPEYSGTHASVLPGYAWSGTVNASTSTRTAAKVEIPCDEPASVAFRYRETETGAMAFGYTSALTGNNVGTYGKISHDGTNLVIESDRLLVIGPVFAFSDTLSEYSRNILEETTDWTFDMRIVPAFHLLTFAGTNPLAPVITPV